MSEHTPPSQDSIVPPLLDAPLSMEAPCTESDEDQSLGSLNIAVVPPPEPDHVVLFVGAGHMSQEAARLAHYAGFAVDVLDCREEYMLPEHFLQARRVELCSNYAELAADYTLEARHYVVILTHSFETDLVVLAQALESPVRYIGVAGSERKKEKLFAALKEHGVPDAELACVRCPIGLPIGAESPQEVALAIVAELVAARTGCLSNPHRRQGEARRAGPRKTASVDESPASS